MKEAHGTARLSDDGKKLTITVKVKRGNKMVDNVQEYEVSDAQPDPRVAYPVIALKKKDGTVYHCGLNEFGHFCDCPNGQVREKYNNADPCKHVAALQKFGIIPKELSHEGQGKEAEENSEWPSS